MNDYKKDTVPQDTVLCCVLKRVREASQTGVDNSWESAKPVGIYALFKESTSNQVTSECSR